MKLSGWQEVIGSNQISQFQYDYDNLILEVEFVRGKSRYIYHKVPAVIYEGLLKADSKGKFLSKHVKGVYDYKKVKEPVYENDQNGTD